MKLFCHLSSRFHKIKKDTGIGESKADIRNPQTDQVSEERSIGVGIVLPETGLFFEKRKIISHTRCSDICVTVLLRDHKHHYRKIPPEEHPVGTRGYG